LEVRPDLKIAAFEDAIFHRFVKVPEQRGKLLWFDGQMLEEDGKSALLRVKVFSDFVHASGMVLQKDVLQTEVSVRLQGNTPKAVPNGFHPGKCEGSALNDPYVMEGSPVRLRGPFRTMKNIVSSASRRRADYFLEATGESTAEYAQQIPKIVMMDSLWRFGAILGASDDSLPVYVPEKCRLMKVYFDFVDLSNPLWMRELTFCGANPTMHEGTITIGPVAAIDSSGRVVLVVEDGLCRRYGKVNYAAA
jgi:hypothetical protein